MRFLTAARNNEEDNYDEKKITIMKHQSILFRSTLETIPIRKDSKGQKVNVFLENTMSGKRISSLLKKVKGERDSLLSNNVDAKRNSIESQYSPKLEVKKEKEEELNENDLQKPIFFYLPHEDEIKEMIFNVLKEIAKEEEFLLV